MHTSSHALWPGTWTFLSPKSWFPICNTLLASKSFSIVYRPLGRMIYCCHPTSMQLNSPTVPGQAWFQESFSQHVNNSVTKKCSTVVSIVFTYEKCPFSCLFPFYFSPMPPERRASHLLWRLQVVGYQHTYPWKKPVHCSQAVLSFRVYAKPCLWYD